MLRRLLNIIFLLIVTVELMVVYPRPIYAYVSGGAGKIGLSPSTSTFSVNQNATVTVIFNSANTAISGLSARITFNATGLDVVSIQTNSALTSSGWSFPISSDSTSGGTTTIDLMALNPSMTGYSTNSDTTWATITLKPTSNFSSKAVTFTQSQTIMTKKSDGADMVGTLVNGTYGASGGTTQTANPTNTPTPTSTPSIGGGNSTPTCTSLSANPTSGAGQPLAVSFTCSGVDPDGDITAVEFVFGDGNSKLVTQNVGSPGSISYTHTYRTIGTLGASCRVRDNNQAFSSTPEACKKAISIRPASAGGSQVAQAIPTPTPTMEPVVTYPPQIESVTPFPTFTEPPAYTPQEPTKTQGGIPWLIPGLGVGAIAIAGFLLFLLKRKGPPPSSPPPPPTQPSPPQAPPQSPSGPAVQQTWGNSPQQ